MKLYTKAQERELLRNWDADDSSELKPVVKLFNPMGSQTWLLVSLKPDPDDDREIAYGLCDLGMGFPELGYVSLKELREMKLPVSCLGIERDLYITLDKTLREYTDIAKEQGAIVA